MWERDMAEGMSSFTIFVFFLKKSIFRARAMAWWLSLLPQRPKYNMDMDCALSRDAIRAILVVSKDIECFVMCEKHKDNNVPIEQNRRL
jgi:hypothetical protein